MRDLETSRPAMEASLTGHLVFSTLHTNSAVDSVVRLLGMGLDSFNFADALLGIIAQRLVRKVCDNCGITEAANEKALKALAEEHCADSDVSQKSVIAQWQQRHGGNIMLRGPTGCNESGQTGYRGRIGLNELFSVSRQARSLMQHRGGMEALSAAAKANGINRVIDGHTDLRQVRAVCG